MVRPKLLLIFAVVITLVLLALHLRIQPSGYARVLRRDQRLLTSTSRVGFAPWYLGDSCLVALTSSGPSFRKVIEAEDGIGELIPVEVSFRYAVPSELASNWPAGSWCSSLDRRVRDIAERWMKSVPFENLRGNPRESGWHAAETILKTLASTGLRSSEVSARLRVPERARDSLPVPAIARRARKEPPVIFIGLDGADWDLLDRYMASGVMPNLASIAGEGVRGELLTDHPPLSPLLWTSMMTGSSPLDHEILDFTRFNPVSRIKEPITSDERRLPAVWNMATAAGKNVAVFGLWATYPAEPVRGLLVSDRLFTFLFSEATPPPGVVYPASRERWARAVLQQAETAVSFERLKQYLPWLDREEFDARSRATDPYSHPVSALRRILVETYVYDRLASEYIQRHRPALTLLYIQGTDSVGHVFAPYTAPRQPNIDVADFERYSRVPETYFREVDHLLGRYRKLASENGARLMIASDHGFHWYEGRPTDLSSFAAATAAKWHRRRGIYLLWGPGVLPSRTRQSGRIAQVCSTLLALTGMPQGDLTAGPPLQGTPDHSTEIVDYRQHYRRQTAAGPSSDPAASNEELAKLKALGYIGAGESTTAPKTIEPGSTRTAGWYNNRGLILKNQNKGTDAAVAFERSIAIDPNLSSALWNLSDLLFARSQDFDRSDALLVRSMALGLPEGVKFTIGRAIGYQRNGQIDRSLKLLEAAVRAKPAEFELRMFRGRYRIEMGNCSGALEDFAAARNLTPRNPIPYASAGLAHLCLGNPSGARASFQQSLAIDPDQPKLRSYLQQAQ